MGEFLIRTHPNVAPIVVPNTLAYEGVEYILRQTFPPHASAPSFVMGISGPQLGSREERPNEANSIGYDEQMEFAQVTGQDANEGGCFRDEMRTAMGYQRKHPTFTASRVGDECIIETPEQLFSWTLTWGPHGDWDDPNTPEVETAPGWLIDQWEPLHGYPWQLPNVKGDFFQQFEPGGDLDFIAENLHVAGGFPITMAFIADDSRNKLIVSSRFMQYVLLRPQGRVYIKYRGRIGGCTVDFAHRLGRNGFAGAGDHYAAFHATPLLQSVGKLTIRSTYADIVPHIPSGLTPASLNWSFVSYDPNAGTLPHAFATGPEWTNNSGADWGPLTYLAVYGSGPNELCWFIKLDPPLTVPAGDRLRAPDGIKFTLRGI